MTLQDCFKERECSRRCLLVLFALGAGLLGCGIAGVKQPTLDHYVPLIPGSFVQAIVAGASAVLLVILNFMRLGGLQQVQKQGVEKKREFANAIGTFQTFHLIALLYYISCCIVQGVMTSSHNETTSTIKGLSIALFVLSLVTTITNFATYHSLASFWQKCGIRSSSTWSAEEEECRTALMLKFVVGAAIIICVVFTMKNTNDLENISFKAAYIVTLVFGAISVCLIILDINGISKVNQAKTDLEKQDAEKTTTFNQTLNFLIVGLGIAAVAVNGVKLRRPDDLNGDLHAVLIALTVLSVLQSLNILWTLGKMDDFYKKRGIKNVKKPANSVSQSSAPRQPQADTSVSAGSKPKSPNNKASPKTAPVKAEAGKTKTVSVVSTSELERQNRLIEEQINLQRSLNQLRSDNSASADCTRLSIEELERRNRLIQQQIQLERELQTFHRENQDLYGEGHMYPPPPVSYTEGTPSSAPPSYESLDPKK